MDFEILEVVCDSIFYDRSVAFETILQNEKSIKISDNGLLFLFVVYASHLNVVIHHLAYCVVVTMDL